MCYIDHIFELVPHYSSTFVEILLFLSKIVVFLRRYLLYAYPLWTCEYSAVSVSTLQKSASDQSAKSFWDGRALLTANFRKNGGGYQKIVGKEYAKIG